MLGNGKHILVAAPAHIHDHQVIARQIGCNFSDMGQRMRRLQRRNNALKPRDKLERLQCLGIGGRHIFHTSRIAQKRMFGANARIIEPGRNRMPLDNLAVIIL